MAQDPTKKNYLESLGQTQEEQTENYYQMAQDQRYKDLLSQEIQLENAKRNAMKYTQAQANNQGFSGTGYGSSMGMSAQNAYLNALGGARYDYNQDVMALNQQKQADMNNIYADRVSAIMNNVASADNMDDLNEYMSANGIEIDGKGNPIKPSWMRDEDWSAFVLNYRQANRGLEQAGDSVQSAKWEDIGAIPYTGSDGTTKTVMDYFEYESKRLAAELQNGTFSVGDYVVLQNGQGDVVVMKIQKNGVSVHKGTIPEDANVRRIRYEGHGKKTVLDDPSQDKVARSQ